MPRRYYGGLSTGGGFAEGVQAGYGLVSDFQDRQLRREEQKSAREYNEARLQIERDKAKSEADYRISQAEVAAIEAESMGEYRKQQGKTASIQAATAATQADTSRFVQETARQNQERDDRAAAALRADEKQLLREQQAAVAVNQLVTYVKSWRAGDGTYNAEAIEGLVAKTKDTMFDLSLHFGPDADGMKGLAAKVSGIQAMIDGEPGAADAFNPEEFSRVLNYMLQHSNHVGVGDTLSAETHPHAPEAYLDGNHEIVGKEMFDPKLNDDGESVRMRVKVMVRDKTTGKVYSYRAPLTDHRSGGTGQASFTLQDMHKALAGFMQLDVAMREARPMIENALIEGMGGQEAYTARVEKLEDRLQEKATESPGAPSVVSGVTNDELWANQNLRNDYIRSEILTGRRKTLENDFNRVESSIISASQAHAYGEKVIDVATAEGEELTPDDWLRISTFLGDGNKADKKGLDKWLQKRFDNKNISVGFARGSVIGNPRVPTKAPSAIGVRQQWNALTNSPT